MDSNGSDNSAALSRQQRARDQMTKTVTAGDGGRELRTEQANRSLKITRDRRPKTSSDKIDGILTALAGKSPKVHAADSDPEADRATERSVTPPPTARPLRSENGAGQVENGASIPEPSTRPAFEPEEDDDAGGQGERARTKKPGSLTEFAEAHEVKPKELYDLTVTIDDGDEPLTIGKLKDHFKSTRDHDQKVQQFEDYRHQVQNEIIKGRNQLDTVLAAVAQVVPRKDMENILTHVQTDAQQMVASAKKELREYFPEWDDYTSRKAAFDKMRGWVRSYGISPEAFDNIMDAKIIRMLWHMGSKAERAQKLMDGGVREKSPSVEPASKRRAPRPNTTQQARELVRSGDRAGAIAMIIQGQKK